MFQNHFWYFLGENLLLFYLLFLICWGVVFSKVEKEKGSGVFFTVNFSLFFLVLLALLFVVLVFFQQADSTVLLFNNVLLLEPSVLFSKRVFLIFSVAVLFFLVYYDKVESLPFEVFFLSLFVIFSSLIILGVNDFLVLYLAIELQSLSFYILASAKRDSVLSSEAGLKYFTIGSLASILLLFGMALFYLVFGTFNFSEIFILSSINAQYLNEIVRFAILLLLVGLFFKLAAAPFHNWAPDVYQGAPYVVSLIFMVIPKLVLVLLMQRVILFFLENLGIEFSIVFIAVGFFSIALGTFFALKQWKLRRLLAYSGIVNVGFVLLVLAVANQAAFVYSVFYLLSYLFLTVNLFAWLFVMRKASFLGEYSFIEDVSDFIGVYSLSPLVAFFLSFVFLSYSGIPPFLGFFSKFFVLYFLVSSGYFFSAFFLLFFSVFALFYYLYFIKVMFFVPAYPKEIFFTQGAPLYFAIFLTFVNIFSFFFVDTFFSFAFFMV